MDNDRCRMILTWYFLQHVSFCWAAIDSGVVQHYVRFVIHITTPAVRQSNDTAAAAETHNIRSNLLF